MFDVSAIGRRIKGRREVLGLTLDEVALRVGVTKGTISRYENGLIERPKVPVLESIARTLDMDPRDLLGAAMDFPAASSDPSPALTASEQHLVESYRRAPQNIRSIVDTALAPYSPRASEESAV